MTTALKYLSSMADAFFEAHMQRAAVKISSRQRVFRYHGL
jgi:hypothetical protein